MSGKNFVAALEDNERGEKLLNGYKLRSSARLFNLMPERQYFNYTDFGEKSNWAN